MHPTIRRGSLWVLSGAALLAAAEIVARVDDWIRLGIPFTHTPDYDRDLKYRDWFGVRGRPNGQFHQWKLNNYGFRGPDISHAPSSRCTRVMVLGASETFGLSESDNHEYPAQLRDSLRAHGCFEVVNTAIPGAGLQSTIRLWEHYLAQFRPAFVVMYPSPTFYLNTDDPKWTPMPGKAEPDLPTDPRPRLIERFRDVWQTPSVVQRIRLERWIARDTAGKPEDWSFREPPLQRLDAFMQDLDSLMQTVQASGAQPILVTHAMRFAIPPDPRDELPVLAWQRFTPRATAEALLGFEVAAATRMREYAERRRIPLVDAARALTGRRDYFSDAIHFTDKGAGALAGLLANQLIGR